MSRKHCICVGIELTVPMEHNISAWHQSKLKKYENELRLEAERNKWTFYSCILEVGARGWIPPSLVSSLNKLTSGGEQFVQRPQLVGDEELVYHLGKSF